MDSLRVRSTHTSDKWRIPSRGKVFLPGLITILLAATSWAGQQETIATQAIQSPGDWQLTSYVHGLTETDEGLPGWAARSASTRHNLLGLKVDSRLPLSGATSTLEYSWSRSEDSVSTAADRQLVQLSLQHQWQQLHYGLRYFSVGEAYGRDPLTRRTLAHHHLAAANQGSEFWARWQLNGFRVEPRARVTTLTGAGQPENRNHYSVTAEGAIGGVRLSTLLEQNLYQRSTDEPHGQRLAEGRYAVRLENPLWKLGWQHHDQQDRNARTSIGRSREMHGAVRLLEDTGLKPAINVGLKVSQREQWDKETRGVEAKVSLSKFVFRSLHPKNTSSIGASISYRREEQPRTGVLEEGFGINLSLNLDISSGS